jgi:hypothetical protein
MHYRQAANLVPHLVITGSGGNVHDRYVDKLFNWMCKKLHFKVKGFLPLFILKYLFKI